MSWSGWNLFGPVNLNRRMTAMRLEAIFVELDSLELPNQALEAAPADPGPWGPAVEDVWYGPYPA